MYHVIISYLDSYVRIRIQPASVFGLEGDSAWKSKAHQKIHGSVNSGYSYFSESETQLEDEF
jgi:predicted secreted protein